MGHLTLKVFPASKIQKIEIHNRWQPDSQRSDSEANGADIVLRLREKAQDNKANIALIKTLSKLCGRKVWIKSGASGRLKVIEFEGEEQEFISAIKAASRPNSKS